MKKFWREIIFSLLLLLAQTTIAQEKFKPSLQFKGYVKDMQTFAFYNDFDSLVTSNLIHNRFIFKWNFDPHFYARVEMRNRVFTGEQVSAIPYFANIVSDDNGYMDLTTLWIDEEKVVAVSTLDRFLMNYSSNALSVTLGRQRINWGINTIWNPNDLFNAYDFLDFDYEERPGVDALRIQYFPKSFSSIEFAIKPSERKNKSVAAALFKFNKWEYDFQLLSGIYFRDWVVGGGWAGHIKEAGFKGEATYFHNYEDPILEVENLTASVAFDYSLKNSWYVSASVLYIQHPSPLLYQAVNVFTENLSAKALMPFRWSYYGGVTKTFTPLFTGNLAIIFSPEDNSMIIFPTLTYNLMQNFDIDLNAQGFYSDVSGSYKGMSHSVFLRARWSF